MAGASLSSGLISGSAGLLAGAAIDSEGNTI
jgi:hypothetical protein